MIDKHHLLYADADADADADAYAASSSGGRSEGDIRPLGRAVPWPPKPDLAGWDPLELRVGIKEFPRHYWDSWRYAFVTIEEFIGTDWKTATALKRPTEQEIDDAVNKLILKTDTRSTIRSSMMSEILAQRSQATRYWRSMLMFNATSHPWTFELMQNTHHIGRFLAMYYKAKFNIPRPSQISPAILPWIDPPPHPSYPSGHALEGMLISLSLGQLVPDAAKPLISLAKRVGRNREIAGLHYDFDTNAGFKIAEQALPLLKTCASYKEIFDAAKAEWEKLK